MTAKAADRVVLPLPDFRLPHEAELPLGTRVAYTHRAAVARWRTGRDRFEQSEWLLTEGVTPRGGWRPSFTPAEEPERFSIEFGFVADPFYTRPIEGVNKTVFCWPEDGEGLLIGLVRRGVGSSYAASRSHGGFLGDYDDFEPGGFHAHLFVPLYAVKHELNGVDYTLHPTFATQADRS